MGLGGCCTFHAQLSGTMEGKNVSSVRGPPHPACLPAPNGSQELNSLRAVLLENRDHS